MEINLSESENGPLLVGVDSHAKQSRVSVDQESYITLGEVIDN